MNIETWIAILVEMHDSLAGAIGCDDDGPAAPDRGWNTEANRRLRDALLWAIYSPQLLKVTP